MFALERNPSYAARCRRGERRILSLQRIAGHSVHVTIKNPLKHRSGADKGYIDFQLYISFVLRPAKQAPHQAYETTSVIVVCLWLG